MSAAFPSAQLPEMCKATVQPQLKVLAKPFQSSLQNMLVRKFFVWLYEGKKTWKTQLTTKIWQHCLEDSPLLLQHL